MPHSITPWKDGLADIGSDIGGAGMIHLKGLRTSKGPGVPTSAASAAFVALVVQRAVSALCCQVEIPKPKFLDMCIRSQGRRWSRSCGCGCP